MSLGPNFQELLFFQDRVGAWYSETSVLYLLGLLQPPFAFATIPQGFCGPKSLELITTQNSSLNVKLGDIFFWKDNNHDDKSPKNTTINLFNVQYWDNTIQIAT